VFSVVRGATVSGQQLSKHVTEATDTNAKIEENVFYVVKDSVSQFQKFLVNLN
jgi:hypothetical protein